MKEKYFLILTFLVGLVVRFLSIWPFDIVIGFDQVRDFWDATTIFRDHNLRVIGPTAGNNPNLHHGVAWLYYIIPPLILGKGNPAVVALWNSIFNALIAVVLYFFAKDLFKSKKVGVIAAIVVSVSFYYVQYSGWLSNPTVCLLTCPLFFYFVWKYYQGKRIALPLALFFLGLTIQFELFFVYLIPTFIILWLILKPKFPDLKLMAISLLSFCVATATMIATEVKFHFAGVRSILSAGQFVGGQHDSFGGLMLSFLRDRWETFYLNFWPQNKLFGSVFGIAVIVFLVWELYKRRKEIEVRKRNLFLFTIFLSPAIMFILGTHNAPWFFIGRPSSVVLMAAYVVSKFKSNFLISVLLIFVIITNLLAISSSRDQGQVLLQPDSSSLMASQIEAVDYTYQSSDGAKFEINTLTNPLYINALWSYHYYWREGKYGYLPTWGGGDQLYPYNSLDKEEGDEKYIYLIMDTTFRIPPQFKNDLISWAEKKSKLVEEKDFGGINVQKRIIKLN